MIETKLFNLGEVKFASADLATKTFTGYGAVFGNRDSHDDVIAKGAFAKSIATNPAPLMLLNHDYRQLPVGRWTNLEEDDYGLKMTGEFLDTTAGRDVYTATKAGAITGLSIGYRPFDVVKGTKAGDPARTLRGVDLREVSVVTIPSNNLARVTDVKAFEDANEFERKLMELGMTLEEAKSFLKTHRNKVETKYDRAVELETAMNFLKTIKETNV